MKCGTNDTYWKALFSMVDTRGSCFWILWRKNKSLEIRIKLFGHPKVGHGWEIPNHQNLVPATEIWWFSVICH